MAFEVKLSVKMYIGFVILLEIKIMKAVEVLRKLDAKSNSLFYFQRVITNLCSNKVEKMQVCTLF